MNGRMYDPVVGRMLSVDNFTSNGTQGYNRYAYALNNPLRYTDPSGESIVGVIIIGAVIGAYIGGATANNSLKISEWAPKNAYWRPQIDSQPNRICASMDRCWRTRNGPCSR
jgi:uncharacterized protein RhaS with RHS repeats